MFVIYANSELEQKQKVKRPEDYCMQNPMAKIAFHVGCETAKEERERFQKVCHKMQHIPREFRTREMG